MSSDEVFSLDEDVEQLLAALDIPAHDLLPSIDVSLPLPAEPTIEPAEANAPRPPATKTTKARKSTSQRQKEELAYLRAKVQELETELHSLRAPRSPAPVVNGEPSAQGSCVRATPVWERIAKHQQQQKRRAELENAKLRTMLEQQLHMAKSFEKVLRKRPVMEILDNESTPHAKRLRGDSSMEHSIFEIVGTNLEALFRETDTVLRAAKVACMEAEFHDGRVRDDPTHGFLLEFVDVRALPFGVDHIMSAAMAVFQQDEIQFATGHGRFVGVKDKRAAACLHIDANVQEHHMTLTVWTVFQVFHEKDRQVIVWESLAEPESDTTEWLSQVQMREHGWVAVTPAKSQAASEQQPLSIQRCVARIAPLFVNGAPESFQPGVLSEIVLSSFAENLQGLLEQLESVLVRQELVHNIEHDLQG